MLKDSFGRVIDNLRISVTDRCNFRCVYCMPAHGMKWLDKKNILSFEEIFRIAGIFSGLGITRLRLTGGEPLIRKELSTLIRMLRGIEKIEDISLTTNGYFLNEQAAALHGAGLKRINISLDSLYSGSFSSVTRRDYYEDVRKGIARAVEVGMNPVKINVVLIRGFNDNEILDFAELGRKNNFIIRFIEFMPLGSDDKWNVQKVVSADEIKRTIESGFGMKLIPDAGGSRKQPADVFRFEDGIGRIGFISSVSEPFCEHCNRVRITSDGKLRTCLFSHTETDLMKLLRGGAADSEIREIIIEAVSNKERGHMINRPGFLRPERTMSQIGG